MTKFWTDLHQTICSTLKKEIPSIQTCEIYPAIRKELIAPALFVELVSLESGKDPGTEELALKARFEASNEQINLLNEEETRLLMLLTVFEYNFVEALLQL